MENQLEKSQEHIPTKEEVLEIIGRFAEQGVVRRELSDERGVYLIEVVVQTDRKEETIEYTYTRKGNHSGKIASTETVIHKTYFDDDIPMGGTNVAFYNENTHAWEEVV